MKQSFIIHYNLKENLPSLHWGNVKSTDKTQMMIWPQCPAPLLSASAVVSVYSFEWPDIFWIPHTWTVSVWLLYYLKWKQYTETLKQFFRPIFPFKSTVNRMLRNFSKFYFVFCIKSIQTFFITLFRLKSKILFLRKNFINFVDAFCTASDRMSWMFLPFMHYVDAKLSKKYRISKWTVK